MNKLTQYIMNDVPFDLLLTWNNELHQIKQLYIIIGFVGPTYQTSPTLSTAL